MVEDESAVVARVVVAEEEQDVEQEGARAGEVYPAFLEVARLLEVDHLQLVAPTLPPTSRPLVSRDPISVDRVVHSRSIRITLSLQFPRE